MTPRLGQIPNLKGLFFQDFHTAPRHGGKRKPSPGAPFFPDKGFMHQLCLVHPALTVGANQGILQKTKDGQFQRFSQFTRGFTEIPLVHIQGIVPAELADPDGVQMAGQGLEEVNVSCSMRLLDAALCNPLVVEGHKGTFLAINQWRDILAIAVNHRGALCRNGRNAFGTQIRFDRWVDVLEYTNLLLGEWRTSVPFDATGPFAPAEITAKSVFKYGSGGKGLAYRNHDGSKVHPVCKLTTFAPQSQRTWISHKFYQPPWSSLPSLTS